MIRTSLLCLALTTTGCTSEPKPVEPAHPDRVKLPADSKIVVYKPPQRKPEQTKPALAVTLRAGVLSYSVRNVQSGDIYVFDPLKRYSNKDLWGPAPQRVYAELKGKVVTLSKRMWRRPLGASPPYVAEYFFLTRVRPGETLRGTVKLGSKVAADRGGYAMEEPTLGKATRVRLQLGYLRAVDLVPTPDPKRKGLFRVWYEPAIDLQRLLDSKELEARIEVVEARR